MARIAALISACVALATWIVGPALAQDKPPLIVGAIAGWWFDRRADRKSKDPEATKQLGVLLASGMIVGEGLLGVVIAGFVAVTRKDYPLSLVSDTYANGPALWIGGAAFAVVMVLLYRWVGRLARSSTSA